MFELCSGKLKILKHLSQRYYVVTNICPKPLFNVPKRNFGNYGNSRSTGNSLLCLKLLNKNGCWTGSEINVSCKRNCTGHSHSKRRRNALKRLKNKPHYDRLGVTPTAGLKEIKSAYYELSKKYHPDVNPSKESKATYSQISTAYEILKDPKNQLEDEGIETDTPTDHTRRRGGRASKKVVRYAPEYAERFDPRWPLGQDWYYSEKDDILFRKDKKIRVTSNRKIIIHDTSWLNRHLTVPYKVRPPPNRDASEPGVTGGTKYLFGGFVVCVVLFCVYGFD